MKRPSNSHLLTPSHKNLKPNVAADVFDHQPANCYFPALQGCRSIDSFLRLNKIEEGTYGVVFRAEDLDTKEIVALKQFKLEIEREGFPITSIREINTLLKCNHENIVNLKEIIVGRDMDRIFMVMEFVENDLKSLMVNMPEPFIMGEIKSLFKQLLSGINHLHNNWIIHRDIKTSNLLLNNRGVLKIGDFGLAREFGSPLNPYTPVVVTLWYRAPELLLGTKYYSTAIDIWSCGCVFAEMLFGTPMFRPKSETDAINLIFKELGVPNDKIWPGPPAYSELPVVKNMQFTGPSYSSLRKRFGTVITECGLNLLSQLFTYDPSKRISAEDALNDDYFIESPLPVPSVSFPTWPAKHEHGKTPSKIPSPRPPRRIKSNEQFDSYDDENDDDEDSTNVKQGFVLSQGSNLKGAGFNLKY